ncbi:MULTISPECIES: response regulator transcription factor [unclassified Rhodococcus (in: high G+C Gram-positive bacteria)]|uniref:response regulator transcription factor n=1 Tax=unclassified Rhodococcus (in: high G+C Gram-positive bacteria) TaxID=192944 RepID=UPI0004842731|nr:MULTISPECIES: response regulator transcription factor [unclassified Rhodococcus (in: high G+C Gram-positive bacteria)]MBY6679125.1 response regulator transcription factor [Rhodococcus sp. BP-332]
MDRRRILVVEDERALADAIAARLRSEGFDVDLASTGPAAVETVARTNPDLVVLDVMLPGFDGLEVCRRIQSRPEGAVAVLMLTARSDETDQLVGLGVGADDYMSKPFSMRTLVARVHALLRRVERHPAPTPTVVHEFDDVRVDEHARRVFRDGDEVHLTRTEFDLLLFLARRPGAAFARDRLLSDVWGWSRDDSMTSVPSRTVDSHVKALRRKLGSDVVRTVHGVGYAFRARG